MARPMIPAIERGARKLADIGRNFVEMVGFAVGLIHRQRLDPVAGLRDQQEIRDEQDKRNGNAGDQDEFGCKRLRAKDGHHFLKRTMRRMDILREQGRHRMTPS